MLPTVFIDIDSTLIMPHQKLSSENKTAIKNYIAKGGKVVLTTGKLPLSFYSLLQELGLENTYHSGCNGGILFNLFKNDFILLHNLKEQGLKLAQKALALNLNPFVYTADKIFYLNLEYNGEKDFEFLGLSEIKPQYQTTIEESILKILFFHDELNDAKKEALSLLFKDEHFVKTAKNFLEIHHQKQTKAFSALKYCRYHQIDIKDCYAIGDSDNDLPLLEIVGHPYIVSNAVLNLKKKGFKEVASCEENGVAMLLNSILDR